MKLFESIINLKINRITSDELLQFANQHRVSLSKKEADDISSLLRGKSVNIFNAAERKTLLAKISQMTSPSKAKQIETMFHNLTGL